MEIPKEISDMSEEELDKAINEKYGKDTGIKELPDDDSLVF